MWAAALAGDSRTSDVLDANHAHTQRTSRVEFELGLLLSGLVKCQEHDSRPRDKVAATIPDIRDELLRRFSWSGNVFRDVGPGRLANAREGRLTSFASQAYPIHGLAELARCVEGSVRPECAMAAQQLVDEQGSPRSVVVAILERVGPHGRGVPGLFSASRWDGVHGAWHFAQPRPRGLRQTSLARLTMVARRERSRGIPRQSAARHDLSLHPASRKRPGRQLRDVPAQSVGAVLASVGLYPAAGTHARQGTLEILRECRSYHLGWLLYANSLARTW